MIKKKEKKGFLKLLVSELTRRSTQKSVGLGEGQVEEVDGEDERCVVEGDSIRGVKANRGATGVQMARLTTDRLRHRQP